MTGFVVSVSFHFDVGCYGSDAGQCHHPELHHAVSSFESRIANPIGSGKSHTCRGRHEINLSYRRWRQ